MTILSVELSRASVVLFVRGFLLLMLASVAIRWPEAALLTALLTAGGIVVALGLFEIAVAAVSRAPRAARSLMVVHAILSFAFGVVSIAAYIASVRTTVILSVTWLLFHALFTLALLHVTPRIWPARLVVFGWISFNVLTAMMLMSYTRTTIAPLLYYGAAYAWAYGVAQISVAIWIRRHARLVTVPG